MMNRRAPMKSILSLSLLLLRSFSVHSQQQVRLFTTSSKFALSLSPPTSWSAHDFFQYESATSKLFHNKLSEYEGDGFDVHAVVTSVHVDKVLRENNDKMMSVDSIVSVTFSEAGLKGALVRGLGEAENGDFSFVLAEMVTNSDMMNLLMGIGLADATVVTDMSFSSYRGAKRGVYYTDTDLIAKRKHSNWPMFFAGVMITLIICGVTALGLFSYLNENGTWLRRQRSNKSVHALGDIDVENATTASGVLGLKGHHPESVEKENENPNHRRRRPDAIQTTMTMDTDDVTTCNGQFSPSSVMTPQSCVSTSSRHPLGITSMRKLDGFLTPQKPKSAKKMWIYDVARFNTP